MTYYTAAKPRIMSTAVFLDINKKRFKNIIFKKSNIVLILSSFVSVLFLISYLFMVNNLALVGYTIKDREIKMKELLKENAALSIQFADIKSLKNLENFASSNNMKNVSNISYVLSSNYFFASANNLIGNEKNN